MVKIRIFIPTAILICLCYNNILLAQQINIPRIELMPNDPAPYAMRNWKEVALGYDSLVFDLNVTGQYLPLIWISSNTVNYPDHESFGLHTVVGTPYPNNAEAINIIPAVIGATLVGVDKSDQNGINWVLMCEEFFNHRPEENVYLNGPVSASGSDWWYDTMPNVFFYQLYSLYPHTGDFDYQFTTVANRWLEAVEKMGGSTTPWRKPQMNYRAWKLSSMSPLDSGVKQPEAAGAIAWILYNAFVITENSKYRIGAEWALEFLSGLNSNPAYELQLPYGVYTAARMNAELGTNYDVEKMLNYCFDVSGNVRNWGAILGNWGGYDCYGLLGEAGSAGYAFIMNGFQHVGALLPMVRYDDRFARAIGKWVLNIANASRLFYSDYLPADFQDSEDWSFLYDPNSYIAHEALREYALFSGINPYATGDAIRKGKGETNLALYGSSHVGIFGGILDTTNVEKILRLDAGKTDYFPDNSYPTYLYFNPFDEEKNVIIDVGISVFDLYDAVANQFLQSSVSGLTSFNIPADQAVLLVVVPAGGTLFYSSGKMLVDDVIVDYSSGQSPQNYPPRIKSLTPKPATIMKGNELIIYCSAEDKDKDSLFFNWQSSAGTFSGGGSAANWTAPDFAGTFFVFCTVADGSGNQVSDSTAITVIGNYNPQINNMFSDPGQVEKGETANLNCQADDLDGDSLTFLWQADFGTFSGSGNLVTWTAPQNPGYYTVFCTVTDGRGGKTIDSLGIAVGKLVAFYPFNGNTDDESGFNNHGSVAGGSLTEDRFGNPNSAYFFDGIDDFIRIPSFPSLNFFDGITVTFDMKISSFYNREAYPLSHGNWENRWKLSITNNGMRWTVKTTDGIKDLDSKTKFVVDKFYHITAIYDGAKFEIYINGELDAFSTWTGDILQTSIDMTMGQALPTNSNYNFKGVLDEVKVFNTGLSAADIKDLYDIASDAGTDNNPLFSPGYVLLQNYPNPFNSATTISYYLKKTGWVNLTIFDILGKKVISLVNKQQPDGLFSVNWNGEDKLGRAIASGIYFYQLKTKNFSERKKLIMMK